MNVVIAIDSFKGNLSSIDAGNAAAVGIRRAFPDAVTVIRPVADGGEGTVDALTAGLGGRFVEAPVSDPLGRIITAKYGVLPDNTAVIEMAAASGLTLLSPDERDPMITSSFGTGELILDAVSRGCRNFIIGIGGSATNDGGIGCLQALGFGLLDKDGAQVGPGAKGASDLVSITDDRVPHVLRECSFNVACDVTNPLCGHNGCSSVFAPQKGADPLSIPSMDRSLQRFAEITARFNSNASPDTPGAGAAGGLGFALMYFLGATLSSGVELVIRQTRLEEAIRCADIVVTGEGCLDSQTAMGKAPVGIAKIAKIYNKPVIAFCGAVRNGAELCNNCGIDAFFPVVRRACSLEQAMELSAASANLADTAEQVFRTIHLFL